LSIQKLFWQMMIFIEKEGLDFVLVINICVLQEADVTDSKFRS